MPVPRWLGIAIPGKKVIAVVADVPDSGPIVIQADNTWTLENSPNGKAYVAMHQRVADYVRQNQVTRVIIKASAISRQAGKLGHLEAAELRGVVIAAAASIVDVTLVRKDVASRSRGSRKVDEYVKDDGFFTKTFGGKDLRAGSREAAFLLYYVRKT